jgi:hypothetical protein
MGVAGSQSGRDAGVKGQLSLSLCARLLCVVVCGEDIRGMKCS